MGLTVVFARLNETNAERQMTAPSSARLAEERNLAGNLKSKAGRAEEAHHMRAATIAPSTTGGSFNPKRFFAIRIVSWLRGAAPATGSRRTAVLVAYLSDKILRRVWHRATIGRDAGASSSESFLASLRWGSETAAFPSPACPSNAESRPLELRRLIHLGTGGFASRFATIGIVVSTPNPSNAPPAAWR